MTIDELRAKAEKAKAWRPDVGCDVEYVGTGEYVMAYSCGKPECDACLGAKRAVEDIAEHVDDAARALKNNAVLPEGRWREAAVSSSECAARIASYFASEPNPVSEFRDAVQEAVQ